MNIAIYGPGAIGSAFAYYLSRAGHTITVIARGARLAQLSEDKAIVLTSGERAPVQVAGSLDPAIAFDAVLVTVLATQVDAILPALQASKARQVMFMFNTFRSIEPLRQAVGDQRFVFGFPGGVFVLLKEGRITPQVRDGTTVSNAQWAATFKAAGIPTSVEDDMQSYLRSHAALVYPLMAMGVLAVSRGGGLTWSEAKLHANAFLAGLRVVKALGSSFKPAWIGSMLGMPHFVLTGMLWAMSRTQVIYDLGKLGSTEPRMLADMMMADMPSQASALSAVRP